MTRKQYRIEALHGVDVIGFTTKTKPETVIREADHYAVDLGADRVYVRALHAGGALMGERNEVGWRRMDDPALHAVLAEQGALEAWPSERLEYLRGRIEAEDISWSEIAELQSLAEHIDPSDVVLLEWAGVPEFSDDEADEAEAHAVAQEREGARSGLFCPRCGADEEDPMPECPVCG